MDLRDVRSWSTSLTVEALRNARARVFALVIRAMQEPCPAESNITTVSDPPYPSQRQKKKTYQSTFRSALRLQTKDGREARANWCGAVGRDSPASC